MMMKEQAVELTAVQLQAVLQYAAERGRYWKASLSADWLRSAARTRVGGDEYRAALQQVRNLAGSRWLSRVTVAELQQQLALLAAHRTLEAEREDA